MDEATRRIGANVRSARLSRGASLAQIAEPIGHTRSWLSKIERGIHALDNRHDLAALADVLRVSPADLTGQPYRPAPGQPSGAAHDAVPAIRRALLDEPRRTAGAVNGYVAAAERMDELRCAGRLDDAAPIAPTVLDGLRSATTGADSASVRPHLAWAARTVAMIVRELGYSDLSLHAVTLLDDYSTDDPTLSAVSAMTRSYCLSAIGVGAMASATRVAELAADALSAPVGTEQMAAAGQLHLAGGFAYAASGSPVEAAAWFDEAQRLAELVGSESTTVGRSCGFGLSNVALHRVSAAVESEEPDTAIRAAEHVVAGELPYASRRASYWVDLGRAHAQLLHDDQAIAAFLEAEELAPLSLRLHPLVREAIGAMDDRPHSAVLTRRIHGLAYRMGLPHSVAARKQQHR